MLLRILKDCNCFFFSSFLFFFSNAVSALQPAIDLLEALELPTNHSRYIGVSLARGFENHMAFKLGKYYSFVFK